MFSSFFKFSIAFQSNFLRLFLNEFLLSCSKGKFVTVSMNWSKFWFLPFGGVNLLLLVTIDSSSVSLSKKNSASLNRLQNASASFFISSIFCARGVGVNLSPFSRILISLCVNIRFDKLMTLTSGLLSGLTFCAILFRLVLGHILKKNYYAKGYFPDD